MKKKVKEVAAVKEEVSFKFNERTGQLKFKSDIPECGLLVLEQYGFQVTEEGVEDLIPNVMEDFEQVSAIVPLTIRINKLGKGKKSTYAVSFDECLESSGATLDKAMAKAHKQWNGEGRPIMGTSLMDMLGMALSQGKRPRKKIVRCSHPLRTI